MGSRAGVNGFEKSCPPAPWGFDPIPGPSSPQRVAIPTGLYRPTPDILNTEIFFGSFGLKSVLLTGAAFWICCVRSASTVAKNCRIASMVEWRGREGGDLLSTALLEMLDFWLTRLSHGRSLPFAGLLVTY